MSKSLRAQEGYLLIDHRNTPGVKAEDILLKPGQEADIPLVGKGTTYESATFTCSHCHRIVIINPLRNRPHTYCPKCDHYICGHSSCTLECRPLNAIFDTLQERLVKHG